MPAASASAFFWLFDFPDFFPMVDLYYFSIEMVVVVTGHAFLALYPYLETTAPTPCAAQNWSSLEVNADSCSAITGS